ncbi:Peptide transporter PTR3-A [Hordeum vulgare]|nr:Peptide transporter PTR3-A [Hordeum vulgare]
MGQRGARGHPGDHPTRLGPWSRQQAARGDVTEGYGMGNVISSFFLSLVSRMTRGRTGKSCMSNNASHLDYYYAFLTLLAIANCVTFAMLASRYKYKAESTETIDVDVDVQLNC